MSLTKPFKLNELDNGDGASDYSKDSLKRWSGYDRYAVRRSLYTSDSESEFTASSSHSSSSSTCPTIVPSRFQFSAKPKQQTQEPSSRLEEWATKIFLNKRKRKDDPIKILNDLATCKLNRRYQLTTTELGRGVSGTVFLVKSKVNFNDYAAKAYLKKPCDRQNKYNRTKFLNKIATEIVMLAQLHHENVIRTFDIVHHQDQIITIMEYCPVNLFKLVKEKVLNQADMQEYFSQLGAGVAYLHNECGIAHRDLKLENLGIGLDGQLKVLDFGSAISLNPITTTTTTTTNNKYNQPTHICRDCSKQSNDFRNSWRSSTSSNLYGVQPTRLSYVKVRGLCGSDPYIAPEIWESVNYRYDQPNLCRCCKACGYDPFKADIWSMGVIYVAMVSGKFPWSVAKTADSDFLQFQLHRKSRLQKFKVPTDYLKLVLNMLTLCPNDRLDIDGVMEFNNVY